MKTLLLVIGALLSTAALSQSYPSRPITLVVGFPPAAAQDIIGRGMARKMSERLGQPVVVENRPGAAGATAIASVSRAAPDGYTLSLGSLGPAVVAPLARKNAGYDPHTAFTPIAAVMSQPLILLVAEAGPYKSLADIVAEGRKRSGKLNYASAGVGSLSNFATEQFNKALGADFVHVPYAGSAPALRALLAGEVAIYFTAASDAVPRLKPGSGFRGLLVTLPKRFALAPDVPSLDEAGLKDPVMDQWFGLFGPAGMPRDVVLKLNEAVQEALRDPALQQSIPGSLVTPGTPEDFATMFKSDLARVARQIEATGFKAE